jgi:hypothetical protein
MLAATGLVLPFLDGRSNKERLGSISSIRPWSNEESDHKTLSPTAIVSNRLRVWQRMILWSYSTAMPWPKWAITKPSNNAVIKF